MITVLNRLIGKPVSITTEVWMAFAALVWLGSYVSFVSPAEAARLTVRNQVSLNVTRSDITGRGGSNQTVGLGTVYAGSLLPAQTFVLPVDPLVGINTSVRKRKNRTWQMTFDNSDGLTDQFSVNVSYTVWDRTGQQGFVSSIANPNARVPVRVSHARTRSRLRNNGSLRWVRGDTFFDIDLLTARNSGAYSGRLRVDVIIN